MGAVFIPLLVVLMVYIRGFHLLLFALYAQTRIVHGVCCAQCECLLGHHNPLKV